MAICLLGLTLPSAHADEPAQAPAAAPADAQNSQPTPQQMVQGKSPAELVELLDHDDFTVREEAMYALLNREDLTEDDARQWYAAAQSDEQRHRLRMVALHFVVKEVMNTIDHPNLQVRGAMGIRLVGVTSEQSGLPDGQSAIHVTDRYPGFPAFSQLRQNDLITHVNATELPRLADELSITRSFIRVVQAFQARQTIQLRVIRQGQAIEVPLLLANYDFLQLFDNAGNGKIVGPAQAVWEAFEKKMTGGASDAQAEEPPLEVNWDETPR